MSELRKRYCVLSCARAALALKDSYPKTHERTLRMFGESFIKAENRPRKMGSNFSRLKALGDKADYSPRIEATKEDAEWSVQVAAEFLEESKSRLKSRL